MNQFWDLRGRYSRKKTYKNTVHHLGYFDTPQEAHKEYLAATAAADAGEDAFTKYLAANIAARAAARAAAKEAAKKLPAYIEASAKRRTELQEKIAAHPNPEAKHDHICSNCHQFFLTNYRMKKHRTAMKDMLHSSPISLRLDKKSEKYIEHKEKYVASLLSNYYGSSFSSSSSSSPAPTTTPTTTKTQPELLAIVVTAKEDVTKYGMHSSPELYFCQGNDKGGGGTGADFNFGIKRGPVAQMVKVKFRRWSISLIAMGYQMRGSVPDSEHAHGAGDQPLTTHGEHQVNTTQVLSAVIVFAHKKPNNDDPASVVNDSMNGWFDDKDKLKKEMQNVCDTVEVHWPFFNVYRKIMEESKGYFSVAVIRVVGSNTQVDLIINSNVRKSLTCWMNAVLKPMGQSIKNVEKETVCTRIESPLLAGMVNDTKVKGQMRIHFYPVNGGYMMMHTDSAGNESCTFFKCSYMETGVGLQPQASQPFRLDFSGSEGMTVDHD